MYLHRTYVCILLEFSILPFSSIVQLGFSIFYYFYGFFFFLLKATYTIHKDMYIFCRFWSFLLLI